MGKSYAEKLRHPKWQRKRLQIMERDNFACVFCLDPDRTLNVHHEYYQTGLNPWEYPDDSLRTLCEACHELCHNSECDKPFLKQYVMDRYCYGTLTHIAATYLFMKHELREV